METCFFYIVECAILNSHILDRHIHSAEHARKERRKRDVLQFKLELAQELIGGFSSRKNPGRPRSMEQERLKTSLGHWPIHVENKLDCVVCAKKKTAILLRKSTQVTHSVLTL